MFLLDRIDFIALVGLLTQTALTWLLFGIFVALLSDSHRTRSLPSWVAAFAALAVALTAVSARFFLSFEVDPGELRTWDDGQPIVRALYTVYLAGKALFAHLLLTGACALAGCSVPALARRWLLVAVLCLAAAPWFVAPINTLLLIQAPVMIGYFCAAFWVLRSVEMHSQSGGRLVRIGLLGSAGAWILHGLAVVLRDPAGHGAWNTLLALNSHVDAALELLLGAGLIIAQLQEAHRQLGEAEAEKARMQAELERDARLRALGTLVSGVAHELNNPLTAILGFAGELDDPVRARHAAEVVREQADRCRGIVRSLSALAGVRPREREAVACADLILRVARGFELQLKGADVRLETELSAVPPIEADRIGIEQIVTNLIANAIQASPPGGTIRATLSRDADHVAIDVTDEGQGVPPELRNRLFEPFFTTKPAGAGTGLGLAVAYAIARTHHGSLSVDDRQGGRGARFRLRLPLASEGAPGLCAAAPAPPPEASSKRVLRLLLVDDEPMVRAAVRRSAERRGWSVLETASAEEALQVLGRESVDVALCDLKMPGIGGQGFYEVLHQSSHRLLERCLFVTGDLGAPEAVAFADSSKRDLIGKPFELGAILSRLEQLASAT